MGDVTYDRIIRTYVRMRDARSALKAEFEKKDRELKDQQETLESFLLGSMNTGGVTSLRTSAGTAYRTETMVPTGSDWSAFYAWVKETNGFDFLFKSIKADAIKDFMDQHDGEVPPRRCCLLQIRRHDQKEIAWPPTNSLRSSRTLVRCPRT